MQINKDTYRLYPQYDFIDHSNKQNIDGVHGCLNVSAHLIKQSLNVDISLICSSNKGDDYEYFLVQEKYFVMRDGSKFKVLKIK